MKKMALIIKILREFRKFIKYNRIEDRIIKQAMNYLEYKKVEKGEYIFKQGEIPEYFYGIIQGKVSIRRVKKKTLQGTNKFSLSTIFYNINKVNFHHY
jgi:CRP-like cAMP-binding protein